MSVSSREGSDVLQGTIGQSQLRSPRSGSRLHSLVSPTFGGQSDRGRPRHHGHAIAPRTFALSKRNGPMFGNAVETRHRRHQSPRGPGGRYGSLPPLDAATGAGVASSGEHGYGDTGNGGGRRVAANPSPRTHRAHHHHHRPPHGQATLGSGRDDDNQRGGWHAGQRRTALAGRHEPQQPRARRVLNSPARGTTGHGAVGNHAASNEQTTARGAVAQHHQQKRVHRTQGHNKQQRRGRDDPAGREKLDAASPMQLQQQQHHAPTSGHHTNVNNKINNVTKIDPFDPFRDPHAPVSPRAGSLLSSPGVPPKGSVTARVVEPFLPLSPGELSLPPGGIVFVTERAEGEWWRGCDPHGRCGVFPASHVEPIGGELLATVLRGLGISGPAHGGGAPSDIADETDGATGDPLAGGGGRDGSAVVVVSGGAGVDRPRGDDDPRAARRTAGHAAGSDGDGEEDSGTPPAVDADKMGSEGKPASAMAAWTSLDVGIHVSGESLIFQRLGSWKAIAHEETGRQQTKEHHKIDSLSDPFSKIMLRRMEPGVDIAAVDEEVNATYEQDRAVLIATMGDISDVTKRRGVHHVLKLVMKMRRLLGQAIGQFEGVDLVKTDDRKAFISCPDVASAVILPLLALELAAKHNASVTDDDDTIPLQFGVDWTGSLLCIPDDYYGDAVNVASKIGEDTATHGEIYVSSRAYEALRAEIDDPTSRWYQLWRHVQFTADSVTQSKVLLHYMSVTKRRDAPSIRALMPGYQQNVPLPRQMQRPSDFVKLVLAKFEPGADEKRIQAEIDRRYMVDKTLLVSDMSSFTYITRRKGIIHFLAMIYKMRSIVIPIFKRHRGQVIKFEADNVFAIFESPTDAVRAGLEANDALRIYNGLVRDPNEDVSGRPGDGPPPPLVPLAKDDAIRISIGISSGPFLYIEEDEDVYGEIVDDAFTLGEDLCEPYEVLVTQQGRDIMEREGTADEFVFIAFEPSESEGEAGSGDDESDGGPDIVAFKVERKADYLRRQQQEQQQQQQQQQEAEENKQE